MSALKISGLQDLTGVGCLNLRSPSGGSANGMPRNLCTVSPAAGIPENESVPFKIRKVNDSPDFVRLFRESDPLS